MALHIVLHTPKKDPKDIAAFFAKNAVRFAVDMAAGKTPAVCIKTWDPGSYGRGDYMFCLWEAKKPADIETVLREYGLSDYVTADIMKVNETDWAQLAKSAK